MPAGVAAALTVSQGDLKLPWEAGDQFVIVNSVSIRSHPAAPLPSRSCRWSLRAAERGKDQYPLVCAFGHCLVESMSLGRLLVDEGLHALEAVWAGIEVLD